MCASGKSYRDTFRLLLQFVHGRLRKAPSALILEDIDAALVAAFLDELEAKRAITAITRNLRLSAIHSFFHYAAFESPAHAARPGHPVQTLYADSVAVPQST